jgi:hypothetical protein
MKGKGFVLGIISIMLICGSVFVGCDTGGGGGNSTKFQGTWKHVNTSGSENAKITFSDDSFSYTWNSGSKSGTFTFTDIGIVFTPSSGSSWTTTYTINGTTLHLNQGTGGFWWYGDFVKE